MRSKKNVETIKLVTGETLKAEFNNYKDMAISAVDWTLFCSYQLKPNFSEGEYKILQLPSMQIVSTSMTGGIMFDYVLPKDCITISVLKKISKKACIDQMKLRSDMIVITDDVKKYNFMCSDDVEIFDISFNKNLNGRLIKILSDSVDKYYVDEDKKIGLLIENIINKHTNTTISKQNSRKIEVEITNAMLKLFEVQEAQIPSFTKSEEIAIKIKQELFMHMDWTMTISYLTNEYNISEKSLQNAFKSLFGITPNQFIRLLKLNIVNHELMQSSFHTTSVQKIARKWGFEHMGRFSKYYSDLFGEKPSVVLRADMQRDLGNLHCVERKEEIV